MILKDKTTWIQIQDEHAAAIQDELKQFISKRLYAEPDTMIHFSVWINIKGISDNIYWELESRLQKAEKIYETR